MKTNTVCVTSNLDDKKLWGKEILLEDLHWINGLEFREESLEKRGGKLKVRLRYRGPLIDSELKGKKLTLKDEQRAISPGQSAVFYSGNQCLGGGIIL